MSELFNQKCNVAFRSAHKQHWSQPSFSYTDVLRPNYGIMLIKNGIIEFAMPEERFCAQRGDVVFLPETAYYEAIFRIDLGAVDNYLVNFEADGFFSNITKPKLILKNVFSAYADTFEQIFEDGKNEELAFKCNAKLYLLLSSIINDKNEKTDVDRLIEKAKKLLLQEENFSVENVARMCCLSESGFRKFFTENVGVAPTVYRNAEKISRAKSLLESTDKSIAEIAETLGFFDAAYFCKIFLKHVGVSPRRYAKNKKL